VASALTPPPPVPEHVGKPYNGTVRERYELRQHTRPDYVVRFSAAPERTCSV